MQEQWHHISAWLSLRLAESSRKIATLWQALLAGVRSTQAPPLSPGRVSDLQGQLETTLNRLVDKSKTIHPSKRDGLQKMVSSCLEFIEDSALTHPISAASYGEKTDEFLDHCRGYLNHKKYWSNLLQPVNVQNVHTACELYPGIASKALWGLGTTLFRNQAFVLAPPETSLSNMRMLNELISLPFPVQELQIDLLTQNQVKFDLLLGNHILQDLLLQHLAKDLVKTETETEETLFSRRCQHVISQQKQIEPFITQLANSLYTCLNLNGHLILSEKPSLYSRSHYCARWEETLSQARLSLFNTLTDLGLQPLEAPDGIYKAIRTNNDLPQNEEVP